MFSAVAVNLLFTLAFMPVCLYLLVNYKTGMSCYLAVDKSFRFLLKSCSSYIISHFLQFCKLNYL